MNIWNKVKDSPCNTKPKTPITKFNNTEHSTPSKCENHQNRTNTHRLKHDSAIALAFAHHHRAQNSFDLCPLCREYYYERRPFRNPRSLFLYDRDIKGRDCMGNSVYVCVCVCSPLAVIVQTRCSGIGDVLW